MSHSLEEVRQIALELPEDDRRQLANSLWESIESESEINEAWKIEVERRIDEIDSGAVELIPWETVRAEMLEMRSQLKQKA
jgi:putative addiction module component (TIGR02574 family)